MIPPVAASERGRAQTEMRAFRGSDCKRDPENLVEPFWEVGPQRVKVPYTKEDLA